MQKSPAKVVGKRAWKDVFSNIKVQQTLTICAFLAIPLFLLILFTYLPLGDMVRYSLYRWDGYSDMQFIGLDNYKTLFTDMQYFSVFKTSIYYFIGSLIQIAVALYFATMFFYKLKGKNFFKGVIFFPYLLNGVAIGFVFLYFFKQGGVLDSVLTALGVAEDQIPLNLIPAVKGAISVYEIPFVMTKGSGGSMTFVIKTLNTAFTDKKIGLSCAMGVVLLIIVMVITVIQKRFVEGKTC